METCVWHSSIWLPCFSSSKEFTLGINGLILPHIDQGWKIGTSCDNSSVKGHWPKPFTLRNKDECLPLDSNQFLCQVTEELWPPFYTLSKSLVAPRHALNDPQPYIHTIKTKPWHARNKLLENPWLGGQRPMAEQAQCMTESPAGTDLEQLQRGRSVTLRKQCTSWFQKVPFLVQHVLLMLTRLFHQRNQREWPPGRLQLCN